MTIVNNLDLVSVRLGRGSHGEMTPGEWCLLEAAAYMAGELWTDSPECVSPVIAAFGRSWNDVLDDEKRQMLVPLLPKMIGTNATDDDEVRFWLLIDWLVRTYAPAWLDLVESTKGDAADLRALPPITADTLTAAEPVIVTAREHAAAAEEGAWVGAWGVARVAAEGAAGDAARAAAWEAAREAGGVAAEEGAQADAWTVEGIAAGMAARVASRGAAQVASRGAARVAAEDAVLAAARAALLPTVEALQASALDLMEQLCAVGR